MLIAPVPDVKIWVYMEITTSAECPTLVLISCIQKTQLAMKEKGKY